MGVVSVMVAAFALATFVGGCARQPAPSGEMVLPQPPPPGPAEAEQEQQPSTLAEALGGVTPPSSFELNMTMNGEEITQLVLLENGKPVKMKVDHHHEGAAIAYVDPVARKTTTYDPTDNSTFEIPFGDDESMDAMLLDADMLEQDVAILGVEDMDGVSCWVVETTAKDEEDKAKVWLDREFGLIRQLDTNGDRITFRYSRINEVAASELEVPAS